MAFVSITRLRLRSMLLLPRFIWLNERVVRQIRKSPGFREGRILIDAHLTLWTITSWDSEAQMRAYRDEGAHRAVMPKLAAWCDEASVARFADRADLPTWDEAHAQMVSSGRASRVRHPSPNHAALNFPPVRWRRHRRLVPAAGP
jgi:hypothetical protein